MKQGYIYILTNKNNTILYTGVTSNLAKRIYGHKNHLVDGFSKRYNLEKLVYYEVINDVSVAIKREKQSATIITTPTDCFAMTCFLELR